MKKLYILLFLFSFNTSAFFIPTHQDHEIVIVPAVQLSKLKSEVELNKIKDEVEVSAHFLKTYQHKHLKFTVNYHIVPNEKSGIETNVSYPLNKNAEVAVSAKTKVSKDIRFDLQLGATLVLTFNKTILFTYFSKENDARFGMKYTFGQNKFFGKRRQIVFRCFL